MARERHGREEERKGDAYMLHVGSIDDE